MSKGEEIYVRKSKTDDPTMKSDTEDEMWDDSSMTAAYDKAVNKANVEIAKQIAMETNSTITECDVTTDVKATAPQPETWKEGMQCRAPYVEDDLDYEAVITVVLDDKECVVRFVGYENSEIVLIESLKESNGNEARLKQIEYAASDKIDDGLGGQSNEEVSVENSKQAGAASKQAKEKKPKKKPVKPNLPSFPMPDLNRLNSAFTGPTMTDFRLPNMPYPPPPLTALRYSEPEDEALSSMLISWYMSGYHTGLYQGLKRNKECRRH